MRRINANITQEAFDVLQAKAKRYGASMGAILTMMLLQEKKEEGALDALVIYKAERDKEKAQCGN